MRLTQDVFLEQQQKLMMTPELRQAIAILQMSTIELSEYIEQELQENPFLEVKEPEESLESEPVNRENDNKIEDMVEYYNDRDIEYTPANREESPSLENFLTRRPSLYEHLEFQLRLSSKEEDDLVIGHYLIGSIDRTGYLCIDLNEVASNLKVPIGKVEEVLQMIQSFHPHGVGARDLSECLLMQLRYYNKEDSIATQIIQHHMEDLARAKLNKIAQALSIPINQVQDVCDLIRTLDPKPGLQYSSYDEVKYIMPDVFVEKVEGEYVVIVNDLNFPRLIVNNVYKRILHQNDNFSQDAKKYLEDKMGSAIWLIRSIEQRRMTLYKVARSIVDIQTEFLDKGVEYMKPLNLRKVAEAVDVHESTVSRATTNKYIQTPQGLFELKYFFSTGVESYGSSKVSSKSIKHMLEEIISSEDSSKPLSDEAISKMLKQKGIRISRRTVAKYRQEMGIPSTMARKRY